MDFRLADSVEHFRHEVRRWLQETLPPGWQGSVGLTEDDPEIARTFIRKLGKRGWGALAWPRQYGGQEASYFEQFVFNEELAYARAPVGAHQVGVGFVGPTLMVFGSPAQQAAHLPATAGGERIWCQGFSEPGSGSDLGNLQTKAIPQGDGFIIRGQKIWTSYAHMADWCILLARTDPDAPKHKGISFFLVDMKSPGITIRPLINMAGLHGFNEVFFDDVYVPRENLVGDLNRGWYVAMATLDFERSSIAGAAAARRTLDDVRRLFAESSLSQRRQQVAVRLTLAERYIESEVALMLSYRVVSLQAKGVIPNHEASVAKLYVAELGQRVFGTAMQVLGLYGQLPRNDPRAMLGGRIAEGYLDAPSATIAGGTSEIQRTVIATRGLRLPRT